jgi:hypothetical protein
MSRLHTSETTSRGILRRQETLPQQLGSMQSPHASACAADVLECAQARKELMASNQRAIAAVEAVAAVQAEADMLKGNFFVSLSLLLACACACSPSTPFALLYVHVKIHTHTLSLSLPLPLSHTHIHVRSLTFSRSFSTLSPFTSLFRAPKKITNTT